MNLSKNAILAENGKMGEISKARDAIKCPKCGLYELRFTPDIGWICTHCHYKG